MMNSAHFLLTQVSPGKFSILETSSALMPGLVAPERWVICIERIPKRVTAGTICKQLAYVVDPHDPPAFVDWYDLMAEGKRMRDRTNKRRTGRSGRGAGPSVQV